MPTIKNQSEKDIENQILEYLSLKNIFAFKVEKTGIYDPTKGVFRKKKSKYNINGISDILGILPNGKFIAIEVKSKYGILSLEQSLFLSAIKNNGGFGFVARSVNDVESLINNHI